MCKLFLTISLCVLASLTVHAQDKLITTLTLTESGGLGYESHQLGTGVQYRRKLSEKLQLDTGFDFRLSRKKSVGGNSTSSLVGLRYYMTDWYLTGGVNHIRQQTRIWNKSALNLFGGVGRTTQKFDWQATFVKDVVSPNRVVGGRFQIEYFKPTRRRVGFVGGVRGGLYGFKCGNPISLTEKCGGGELKLSVGVYIKTGRGESR